MAAPATCPGWEALTDWWAGDLEPAPAAEVEEHLFCCTACHRRAEALAAIAAGVANAARQGDVSGPVTPGVLRRLERDGLRIHRYQLTPGQVVPCSVWPEDQVMAAELRLPPAAAAAGDRLDLVAHFEGRPPLRVTDVPHDPASGTITWLTPAAAERASQAGRLWLHLLQVAERGETVVAEYTLAHEPWSGPGSPG